MEMNKRIDTVKYRGKRIPVYVDEDGQGFFFRYDKQEYGCGTFNGDYYPAIISVVDKDLDKVFYVQHRKECRPSAKVYQKDGGRWLMDYNGETAFELCLGDILPKGYRPTKEEVTEKALSLMDFLDDFDEKIKKYQNG